MNDKTLVKLETNLGMKTHLVVKLAREHPRREVS